jgi:hypothetical protein
MSSPHRRVHDPTLLFAVAAITIGTLGPAALANAGWRPHVPKAASRRRLGSCETAIANSPSSADRAELHLSSKNGQRVQSLPATQQEVHAYPTN